MSNINILNDIEIHQQIKELVEDMLVLEIDYMPDEEVEEVVAQVKDIVKIKFYDKNARINKELKMILKDKLMYDVEDKNYNIVGKTTIQIIDKIMGKMAKKFEKKLCIILGLKKEGCLKTTFRAIKNMFRRKEKKKTTLSKKDVEKFRKAKITKECETRGYRPAKIQVSNRQIGLTRELN